MEAIMATTKTYVVPIDFSKTSEKALAYAVRVARENKAKLLLIHVIADSTAMVPFQVRDDYLESLNKEARAHVERLVKRHHLRPKSYRILLLHGSNAAQLISDQARKSRAAMIIMGSHGRTGLTRVILSSVAEETLRYARCPVLIVK
jgi:universal stress protein A